MTATTAGFIISVKGRRVWLVDVDYHEDPGISAHEAKELAARLLAATPSARSRTGGNPIWP